MRVCACTGGEVGLELEFKHELAAMADGHVQEQIDDDRMQTSRWRKGGRGGAHRDVVGEGNSSRMRALAEEEEEEVDARFPRTYMSKGTATMASLQGGSGFGCFSKSYEDAVFIQFPATDLLRGDHRGGSWSLTATMEALGLEGEETEDGGAGRGEELGFAGEGAGASGPLIHARQGGPASRQGTGTRRHGDTGAMPCVLATGKKMAMMFF